MKIVFITNYFNHHQKFLADEMNRLTNGNYHFISTQPIEQERLSMGWGREEVPAYVRYTYISSKEKEECQKIIDDADVVILGNAPYEYIKNRLKKGKLVFGYSERPYKIKPPFYKYLVHFFRNLKNIIRYRQYYMLCASAYTAADYAKCLTYIRKTYKWGYFTELKEYPDIDALIATKDTNSILWCARFIDWKHPEIPIEIAKRLKADGYSFELNMIGSGDLQGTIQASIENEGLNDFVHILGSMTPEQVRCYMESSEIFLFTSDKNEGWGAVLNESMNSACAVVADCAIGAVPFMIIPEENGLVYQTGDIDSLYLNVKKLLDERDFRESLARSAYATICREWNPKVAAYRFIKLAESFLVSNKTVDCFESGVCSRAAILKDGCFLGER